MKYIMKSLSSKMFIAVSALIAAGSGVSSAAVYTWTGDAGNSNWEDAGNWDPKNGYYPQSSQDTAIIGNEEGTPYKVVWSMTADYFGATNAITLYEGSTITVADTNNSSENLEFRTLNLYGTFKAESSVKNALRFANDFTVNFGDITQDSHGLLDFSAMTGKLWFNSHTITVNADATVSGRGTMTLISFAGNTDATAAFDTTGIAVHDAFGESLTLNASAETLDGLAEGEFAVLAGNSGVSIIYNVAAVPEPSSFGLLAGLGAIALAVSRRKRR